MDRSIYELDDYREILKEKIKQRKESGRPFSFRWFSRQAGFQSPNFLKLVLDGNRDLSSESIEKVIQVFKMPHGEAIYFRNLVLLQKTKNPEERKIYARQILKIKGYQRAFPLSQNQFKFYQEWYHVAIRELINLPQFEEEPSWISQKLRPIVPIPEVEKSLKLLFELGLVERNQKGQLKVCHKTISTQDRVSRSAVGSFHQNMMSLGQQSIIRIPAEEREISCVTVPVSAKSFEKIKSLIVELKKEILEISEGDPASDRVLQINFQAFPLSLSTGNSHEK